LPDRQEDINQAQDSTDYFYPVGLQVIYYGVHGSVLKQKLFQSFKLWKS